MIFIFFYFFALMIVYAFNLAVLIDKVLETVWVSQMQCCDCFIVPTHHHYAISHNLLAGEKVSNFENSISRNLGTNFLSPAPKMYNNIDKNTILMTIWNYNFCGFYRCVNSGESLTNLT